jgi:hypothetical protein
VVGVAKGDGDGDIVFGRERDAMLESRGLRVNFEGERWAQSRELPSRPGVSWRRTSNQDESTYIKVVFCVDEELRFEG